MKAEKTYKILKRGNNWVPAIISLTSGRVLRLFKDLKTDNYETAQDYLKGIKRCGI